MTPLLTKLLAGQLVPVDAAVSCPALLCPIFVSFIKMSTHVKCLMYSISVTCLSLSYKLMLYTGEFLHYALHEHQK